MTGTTYFTLHETRERIQQAHYWSRHGVPPPGYRCKRVHLGQLVLAVPHCGDRLVYAGRIGIFKFHQKQKINEGLRRSVRVGNRG